jgi:hypothetical protein
MMSVDLSITMTAAVPRPDCASFNESKSILYKRAGTVNIQDFLAEMFGEDGDGTSSWDYTEEVIPSTTDAATVSFD